MRRHAESERRLAQVREDGRALVREAEQHPEHVRALAGRLRDSQLQLAEHTSRAAESAGELRELRDDLRVQSARVAELQRDLSDQRAKLATRTTQLQTLRAGRAHRLATRWWRIRKAIRHPLRGGRQ
jgi:chromosome segregation ATPase